MAEIIPIVETVGSHTWHATVNVGGHTDALTFRVVGGTFADGTTDKQITPTTGSDYDMDLKATSTVSPDSTQSALVYYQDGDLWVLVKSASRMFMQPQKKELDYRLLTQGFDALPLGATLNPVYNGLILGGGVRIPTAAAMQTSPVKALGTMESTIFDSKKPTSFVYDRPNKTFYWISNAASVDATRLYGAMTNVDLAGYKVSYVNGVRTVVLFRTNGLIETYDQTMYRTSTIELGYRVTRVVCRRAGVGSNVADSYVVFDRKGRAHYLNAAMTETAVKSDNFYVNASDSYDVLSTNDGRLVGATVSNSTNGFWYQFVPSSFLVFGYDPTSMKMLQFNVRDNKLHVAERDLITNDCLVYNTPAAWTETGGKIVAGMDTNGTDALFGFADGETPSMARTGWSYAELLTPPYTQADTYDRLFYYASQPTNNLKHLTIRNYNVVWPDLKNVELGPVVTFKYVVDAQDKDIPLPLAAPAGVTMTATVKVVTVDDDDVEHVEQVPVTHVYHGDEVTFTLSHSFITSSSFPISIGRTVYEFEMQTDDKPDALHWENILGVENDTWNRTEDVTVKGINVAVPVAVTIDGVVDYSRVKIFVDGTETAMPVYVRNNQTLGFEVLQKNNTTRVAVTVGQGGAAFGVYTLIEAKLDVGRHWAYMPIGKEIRSSVMKNTGTIPLVLTITETDAQFSQGGQTLTLPVNGTTQLVFTPTENKQYSIKFNSDQYSYEWHIWADDHWLGEIPATKRAERYVMGDSGDIFFGNVPENFWTYIKVPAGMLLDIDGVRVVIPLDSRGVYKEQNTVLGPFECAETMLKIYGLPSHDQPHTLMLGNAPLPWLYDMTVDPTYEVQPTHFVGELDLKYDARYTATVQRTDSTYLNVVDSRVIVAPEFDRETEDPLEWFDWPDVRTHAAESVPVTFISPANPRGMAVSLPTWITGPEDHVGFIPTVTLEQAQDVVVDTFETFEILEGRNESVTTMQLQDFIDGVRDRADTIDLFTFFGTDRASAVDQFPLFEAITGQTETSSLFPLFESFSGVQQAAATFPLFESFTGTTVVHDSFEAKFFTERALRDDTFSNTFVEMLEFQQTFDLFKPEFSHPKSWTVDQLESRFAKPPASYKGQSIYPRLITLKPPQVDVSDARKVESYANFPQPVSQARLTSWNSALYHIGWNRPIWRPASVTYKQAPHVPKYIDPLYHPAVLFQDEIPFVRWHSSDKWYTLPPAPGSRMEDPKRYKVLPAPYGFFHMTSTADNVLPNVPHYRYDAATYKADMLLAEQRRSGSGTSADPALAVQVQAPKSIDVVSSSGRVTSRQSIKVAVQKTRISTPKTYGVQPPVFETWTVAPDHGDKDEPLKEGYFETELLALQDATQVWGFDPSMVYAIRQVNGYWTWAQVTVCEETCGSMSCSARGYLSGG